MGLSFTEKIGFLREITEFMEQNAEALKEAGFNTDIRHPEQQANNDNAVAQDQRQESLKAELHEQTKVVNAAMEKAYVMASGNLDAMAGVLGKNSEKSKVLLRLRSKVRQAGKEGNKVD